MRPIRVLLAIVVTAALPLLVAPVAQAIPVGCEPGSPSDFNGDGYADAAVGDPSATVAGQASAGRVIVRYGDADGLVGEGATGIVSQETAGVGDVPELRDQFGFALAAADLDCDDHTDLLVGVPFEDLGAQVDTGLAQVVWGSSAGLGLGPVSQQYSQSDFDGAAVLAGDQFGSAVDALEDAGPSFEQGEPHAYAVAIGAPGRDVGGDADAGWVGFRLPSYDVNLVHAMALTQDTPGIPGGAEPGDRFGSAVSLNNVVGSEGEDLVVGAPSEDVGNLADAGTITVVGSLDDTFPDGFADATSYDQNSAGVPDTAEAGDRFGSSLDTLRVGALGRLAVGAPNEDVGAATDAGLVQLFSAAGPTLNAGTGLTQDTANVAGVAETGDEFGAQVAWAHRDEPVPVTQLAVGAPREDGAANDSGWVQVFPLDNLGAELTYSQGGAGIPGTAEVGDRFGRALAVVHGPGESVLLIGSPDDAGAAGSGVVTAIPLFTGGPGRQWLPGVGGVPGGAGRFGAALAGGAISTGSP